ncbi:hypothetical protein JTE90_020382 [Oedothorax gibbosus]|uniref:Uncharacterized protein n=1 Tax=Oedothorax gibbosus TaxID=931172 RepID=A0AAV6UGQ5_9ARAC|nr:hypothetical protein JTE90_020382 [Oedothorax gibbosus]
MGGHHNMSSTPLLYQYLPLQQPLMLAKLGVGEEGVLDHTGSSKKTSRCGGTPRNSGQTDQPLVLGVCHSTSKRGLVCLDQSRDASTQWAFEHGWFRDLWMEVTLYVEKLLFVAGSNIVCMESFICCDGLRLVV